MVRIYKTESYAEFQWMVGEIPVSDGNGREIVTRFDTNIESNGVFYTDTNGREMLKRRRDQRDTWTVNLLEKISGNYYPVTAKIAIEDVNHRMAILTDRAQGGSSLYDGSIEIMVTVLYFIRIFFLLPRHLIHIKYARLYNSHLKRFIGVYYMTMHLAWTKH